MTDTPIPADPRPRNRGETEAALRRAARDLLAEQGFSGLGVNAVARRAGCDKQLIYRYFGGLDGLLAALGADLAQWVDEAASPPSAPESYADLVEAMLLRLARALRSDPLVRQITAWEVMQPSPLLAPLSRARSAALQAWVEARRGSLVPPAGADAPALVALLVAGVQHLALAEHAGQAFAGLTLDDAGWARIEAMVARLVRAALTA